MRRASSQALKAIGGDEHEGPSLIDLELKQATRAQLDRLLRPRSIALVGASSTRGSLGDCVLNNLEEAGYPGELHLVNPKRPTIRERTCLGSIEELPVGVDCAVLAIPGPAVVESVRACAARQVGSAIVFSAGFAEAGEAGRSAQGELQNIAREHGMIVEGPNCLGMVNYVDGIPLTFVVTPPQEREDAPGVAIVSQSGALAAVIAVNMRHHGIPLTYSVSTGNEAATGVEDFIEHLICDRTTRVFALVVEQFRQPKRFLDLVRRANEADQLIVLLHPGRSGKARSSAATHTGAMAGDYEVMHTLVTHAGVIHVDSMEELVDVAQILVRCLELPSGGAAVFTESGAFKALALDLCDRVGLELPDLSPQAREALKEALPAFIPPSNPLDLTAQGLVDPDLYRRTLPPVLNDERFGSVLLGIILTDPKTTQLKLPPIVDAIRSLSPRKPMVFAALDEGAPFDFPELAKLRKMGVACFPSPERAIRALADVTSFALRRTARDRALLADAVTTHPMEGVLPEWESKNILVQLGVAVPQGGAGTEQGRGRTYCLGDWLPGGDEGAIVCTSAQERCRRRDRRDRVPGGTARGVGDATEQCAGSAAGYCSGWRAVGADEREGNGTDCWGSQRSRVGSGSCSWCRRSVGRGDARCAPYSRGFITGADRGAVEETALRCAF